MKLFTIGSYTFCPTLPWFLLTCLIIYILSSLGFWQLHRADEKRTLLTRHQSMKTLSPISINNILSSNAIKSIGADQPIQVTGTYDAQHLFFLDNQFHQHQIGYEIIQPVILHCINSSSCKRILLVSRGWIPASANRQELPTLHSPSDLRTLQGVTYFPSKSFILLGANWDNKGKKIWPKRIEKINLAVIEHWLTKPVYPFILRLNANEPDGFIRDWTLVSMPPERHTAYAIQWFAMALTVMAIFILLSMRRNDASKK